MSSNRTAGIAVLKTIGPTERLPHRELSERLRAIFVPARRRDCPRTPARPPSAAGLLRPIRRTNHDHAGS